MASNFLLELTEDTLSHMDAMASGYHRGGILLTGDPGIGKTTYIEMLGALLGMEAIVIEVPHITEEHLVNIPFIVYNPHTDKARGGTTQVKGQKEYEMTLADSNLYTQLISAPSMSDQQYLQYMKTKAKPAVQQLYMAMGGTETEIPEAIAQARKNHKVILFLDEFMRQTTMRIRNILRGILNNNIGKHKMPPTVYTIYATNMRDGGLEDIPTNYQFSEHEFETPKAEDWFKYFVSKYQQHEHVRLDPQVMAKFKEILEDKDISYENSGVRTSPRRWENLLTYINAAIPVENTKEARALITNVKNNFIHYQSEEYSDLAEKVVQAVRELIEDTSHHVVNSGDTLEKHEWRDALDHYIQTQIKSGGARKHIPVVSGPPGIGKTSQAALVAEKYNLRLIEIDISEFYADDAIGMPIPGGRDEDGKIKDVKFSLPKLYQRIMDEIKKKDNDYIEYLSSLGEEEAHKRIDAYKKQKFKYLIFFDEMNRVDEKTFNAMRRVILEKNFGPGEDGEQIKLPKESLVVGAINPNGTGTEEFTDHFRDVIDVIPAVGSWSKLKQYLESKNYKYGREFRDVAMALIEKFVDKFKTQDTQTHHEERAFNLELGNIPVYLGPREFEDLYSTLTREIERGTKKVLADPDLDEGEAKKRIVDIAAKAFRVTLNFPLAKANAKEGSEEFMATLRIWLASLPDSIWGEIFKKRATGIKKFSSTMQKYFEGHDLLKMSEDHHIINANDDSNDGQILQEMTETLETLLHDDASLKKYVIEESHDQVVADGTDGLKFDPSVKVSLVENVLRALAITCGLIHQYQFNRLNAIGKSLSTAMINIRTTLLKDGKISQSVADEASEKVSSARVKFARLAKEMTTKK